MRTLEVGEISCHHMIPCNHSKVLSKARETLGSASGPELSRDCAIVFSQISISAEGTDWLFQAKLSPAVGEVPWAAQSHHGVCSQHARQTQLQGQPALSNPSPVADSGYTQSLGRAGV